MRSRAFCCACWGRKTRSAPRTVQLGHEDTAPLFFFPFAFLPPFAVIVVAVVVVVVMAGAMLIVVAMLAVLVVLALLSMLAVLALLSLLAVLAVLSTLALLAVLAVLAVLPCLHRLFVLASFPPPSPLSFFSLTPVLPIVNGPSRPSPNPRGTVTNCGSGSGGSVLVANELGVCVCSLHLAGPRGVMGLGRLTTHTSGSSLPGPLPLLFPLSPRLFERDRPYSVKLPLSLRRSSGWRRAAIAALTRSAHSLRFQIRPVPCADLPFILPLCFLSPARSSFSSLCPLYPVSAWRGCLSSALALASPDDAPDRPLLAGVRGLLERQALHGPLDLDAVDVHCVLF